MHDINEFYGGKRISIGDILPINYRRLARHRRLSKITTALPAKNEIFSKIAEQKFICCCFSPLL